MICYTGIQYRNDRKMTSSLLVLLICAHMRACTHTCVHDTCVWCMNSVNMFVEDRGPSTLFFETGSLIEPELTILTGKMFPFFHISPQTFTTSAAVDWIFSPNLFCVCLYMGPFEYLQGLFIYLRQLDQAGPELRRICLSAS